MFRAAGSLRALCRAPQAAWATAQALLPAAASLQTSAALAEPALAEEACRQLQHQQPPAWTQPSNQAGYKLRELMPHFRGLLVDAAGTLLSPSEPAAEVYLRYARKFGCDLTEREVLDRFRQAYNTPWGESTIRYVGDGRPFWRHIIASSTGCCSEELCEELYSYYSRGSSYFVTPGARDSLLRIRASGMKVAVVSNFDTRLPRILTELGIADLFDAVIISAEIRAEKPNPVIFETACAALGLPPEQCVHVGDDRRNDLFGARDSGCFAWLWGQDVHTFEEVERRLATQNYIDSLTDV